MQSNVQDALSRRAVASSSLIPSFQQTLLSRGEPPSMPREFLLESAISSGGSSPLARPRHDTTATTGSLSTSTVVVPIVNSSALGDRDFRKASRADSTDSTTSTLPGELLLYEPGSNRISGKDNILAQLLNVTYITIHPALLSSHSVPATESDLTGRLSPNPAGQVSSRLSLLQSTSGGSSGVSGRLASTSNAGEIR